MRHETAIPPSAGRCLVAAVLVSCLSMLAAGSFATENQAPADPGKEDRPSFADHGFAAVPARIGTVPPAGDSFLARRPAAVVSFPRLSRLLTWADDEKGEDKGENANKNGDKKEGEDAEKEEPLESDRPDFTESSTTVGNKILQIESGYTYTHAVAGVPAVDEHDLPELLVRYGIAERLHCFNEFYAWFRRDSLDNRTQFYYNGGLTFLVTKNFQVDWRAGRGLNDASDRFFTGCGLTIRK